MPVDLSDGRPSVMHSGTGHVLLARTRTAVAAIQPPKTKVKADSAISHLQAQCGRTSRVLPGSTSQPAFVLNCPAWESTRRGRTPVFVRSREEDTFVGKHQQLNATMRVLLAVLVALAACEVNSEFYPDLAACSLLAEVMRTSDLVVYSCTYVLCVLLGVFIPLSAGASTAS